MNYPYLPRFDFYLKKITIFWVKKKIKLARTQIENLIDKHRSQPNFLFVCDLEEITEQIENIWNLINHINNVVSSKRTREIYIKSLNDFNDFFTFVGQNTTIYQYYHKIKKKFGASLNLEQKRVITKGLENFELDGVGLPAKEKKQYKKNSQSLLRLNKQFSDNVLDETDKYFLVVKDLRDLAGLPEINIEQASLEAKKRKIKKKSWVFTHQATSFLPAMKYLKNVALRKKLYLAYIKRATTGKRNNSPLIKKILDLRWKQAQLLNFKNHAEKKLSNRMAKNPTKVIRFLNDLFKKSIKLGLENKKEILAFKKKNSKNQQTFKHWDLAFYRERIKEEKYSYQEEKIKEFFPHSKVLLGLFTIVKKLFGFEFVKKKNSNVWNKDVEFYNLYNLQEKLVGHVYLDLFARSGKRGGAWIDECLTKKNNEKGQQLPVAYLVTNFMPINRKGVSLLTHYEVVILFHEMGHVLHHLFSQVKYLSISGINGVPWDGVELPSQFFENWAWEEKSLIALSSHYKTGKSLPRNLFQAIKKSRNYHSALLMLNQLEYALIDMHLHLNYPKQNNNIHAIVKKVNKKISLFPALPKSRFENSFTHIFGGGYSAGYYSYKWAEVLAADAFSVFKKEGIYNKKWAKRFLENILAKGGSEDFMKIYIQFRGKKPDSRELLKKLEII